MISRSGFTRGTGSGAIACRRMKYFGGDEIRTSTLEERISAMLFGTKLDVDGIIAYHYRGDIYIMEENRGTTD